MILNHLPYEELLPSLNTVGILVALALGSQFIYHNFILQRISKRNAGFELPYVNTWFLPIIGHLFFVLMSRKISNLDEMLIEFNGLFRRLKKEHGDRAFMVYEEMIPGVSFKILNIKFAVLVWPEDIKYVTQTNFKNYVMGDLRKEVIHDFLGTGIFASDDEYWKDQRNLAKPTFQNVNLETMLKTFEHHGHALLSHIEKSRQEGKSLDVQNLFMCYTLDCSGEILFQHSIGSLHDNIPFQKAFDYLQYETEKRVSNPFWKLMPDPKYTQSLKICNDFVQQIINKARADSDLASRNDLLAHFMTSMDENGQPRSLDDKFLRDTLMNFMIAGRDTTAVTLTWFFYEISKNQRVQDKIVKELNTLFPSSNPSSLDELRSLKYLKDSINETLRLYPPVPRVLRCSRGNDVLPTGYQITGNTNILYQPYMLHRLECFWGEDALAFDPDRWSDERTEKIGTYEFLPFHGGPRRCLGFDLAYNEAKMAILMILRKYKAVIDEKHKVVPQGAITLCAENGVKVYFSPRD